jgi:hypothetical protein
MGGKGVGDLEMLPARTVGRLDLWFGKGVGGVACAF